MIELKQSSRSIPSRETRDGAGVRIRRIAGEQLHGLLDPFLLLDEIRSDDAAEYSGGFPSHPHRGFETVTYMIAGRIRHRDHLGNEGVIGPGDVQWMTAGAGVVHSEMPEQEQGLLHGFQIWLNLPGVEKMTPASYRDIRSAGIPVLTTDQGVQLHGIAGEITVGEQVLAGAVSNRTTAPVLVDIHMPANATVEVVLETGTPAFVYPYAGAMENHPLAHLAVYASAGRGISMTTAGQTCRALLLSGRPIREPVVQHGPFVMNTAAEIRQAIDDYQSGRLTAHPPATGPAPA